jgi:hypothetical protein
MSVTTILLPIFVHVAFVFMLMFRDWRAAPSVNEHGGAWREEIAVAVLFYVLTICAWQTRRADILFLVLASSSSRCGSSEGWGMGQQIRQHNATYYSLASSSSRSCGQFMPYGSC